MYLHVKCRIGVVALKKRKIGLGSFFSQAAVTEIRHHTDDLDIGFGVWSCALTDPQAQRIPSCQITLDEAFAHDGGPPAGVTRRAHVPIIEVAPRQILMPIVRKKSGVTAFRFTSSVIGILLSARIVIGSFQLPPVSNGNRATAAACVMGDCRMSSLRRRITRLPPRGEYPLAEVRTPNDTRLVVWNPGPFAISASRVRTNRAAPTTKVNVRAICTVTIILRMRTLPKAVPPRSRSAVKSECRCACQPGARPLRRPDATLTASAKSKRRESTPACNAFGAFPCGRNAMRIRTASGAAAVPSRPPASAISKLSVRSCRPRRPREAQGKPRPNLTLMR